MSDQRRRRPPNRWGCKPTEDVCVAHDMPLECRHGCVHAEPHKCNELDESKDLQEARKMMIDALLIYNPDLRVAVISNQDRAKIVAALEVLIREVVRSTSTSTGR